jgi:DinB superfamily
VAARVDLTSEEMRETQAQYKARILRHVGGREPLPLLAAAPDTLATLLADVSPALFARRPALGKWSIQEIVAHLADDELVGAYRIRLILAAPGTAIQAFDQDVWAETGRYAATDPWQALALFRALREANLALWGRLTPAEWEHAGVHAERGVESIRDIATYYAGHDLNHFAQIEAILATAGPAPSHR